ncbi:MAG: amidohydrolase family protein [Christensenellales bacterium]|jgi:guanine deaminase
MKESLFALKGTFAHTPKPESFIFEEDSYLVCHQGRVEGIYPELPKAYENIHVYDFSDKLIIPGMCDMHLHAPQYAYRGIGMNIENPEWGTWFERYAFPDESRYADLDYARLAYTRFVDDWMKTTTTRGCIYATIHRPATLLLMELLADRGFAAYVGKVNMDRNSIPGLLETTEESISETLAWLDDCQDRFAEVKPMLTPRYTPSCSDELMEALGAIAIERNIPVQSHLSEGLDEIEWVYELKPGLSCYGQAYDMYHMFGSDVPAVMAHCVYPNDCEFDLMSRRKQLMVAHCPQSNFSSSGGVAPVKRYLKAGVQVGLGSDMAGSNTLSLLRIMADAVLASKALWAFTERKMDPYAKRNVLSLSEAFYLSTKGGGALWGDVGSFEDGFLLDAVVLDESRLKDLNERSFYERLERLILLSDDRDIVAKFINGRQVYG